MIKPKGLQEILAENPSLTRKLRYEEYQDSIQGNFDDADIEEAYRAYQSVMADSGEHLTATLLN